MSFEIRALRRDAGETWLDEAVVIVDGADALATLGLGRWQAWMGRRPEHVIGPDSSLLPGEEPHDAFVARCDCGEEGCRALIARISWDGGRVVWDNFRSGSDVRTHERAIQAPRMVFDAARYEAAIHAPGNVTSGWKPITRQAAGLVGERSRALDLSGMRLRFGGCRSRGDRQVLLDAMLGVKGDNDRCILRKCFTLEDDESAEALASRIVDALKRGALLHDADVDRGTPF